MKRNGEGSKTTSCFNETRRDSSEHLKEKAHEGEMQGKEKFVEFRGGMWKKEERTPNMPLMEQIRRRLNKKVDRINEFRITLEKVKTEISKRNGWTAPGIDGIQSYCWKS